MLVRALDHVNIRTPQFEETLVFYERVLGLRRGPAVSNRARAQNLWLYTEAGAALIHVNGPEADETTADVGQASRLHHVALSCTGLAATRARLANLGIPAREVRLEARGMLQLNITDPNGILLELLFDEAAEA
jgi:catechol 2,3-dioxygenase-like lactoylglutathione lyase family enzyme